MKNHSLIERIRSKDSEEALKEVYNKYRKEFFLWAVRKHSCSVDDAKDVFQQTIVIFYENVRSGKVTELTSHVKTYLFSIGKNKMLELMRQKKKLPVHFDDVTYFDAEQIDDDLDDGYEKKIRNIELCLEELGNPCKKILQQYYYHKKSMIEISEILDYKNSDTVKNLKYKCLQRLREIYTSQFGELSKM